MTTLREMRIKRGKTQADMASELGISRPTYIKFENDPSAMSVGSAQRICELLDCSINDVVFFADDVKTNCTERG